MSPASARKRPPAPELSEALEWLNCEPQTLVSQRGLVQALVIWSAGSVLSQNLLRTLRALHARCPDDLRVIAVHTPKFECEREADYARLSAEQIGLDVPVAHDPGFVTWQHYRIQGWPSVALIDRGGRLSEVIAGDVGLDTLWAGIERLLAEEGAPAFRRPPPRLIGQAESSALRFPSGLVATDRHLYIADSGRHRILECSHEGKVLRQFGTGLPDLVDGASSECAFHSPAGLALAAGDLFVADAGNHALRRVRLLAGEVETIAARGRTGDAAGVPAGVLSAPRGLAGDRDRLFVALAGSNQVWSYDFATFRLHHLAGSGALESHDGRAAEAALAQPAGLALVHQTLYICDSASSSLRSLNVRSGEVETLVGGSGLFDYGDRDGERAQARLQYPLAAVQLPGSAILWIADAGNHCLREMRLGGGPLRRLEFDLPLRCPSALAVAGGVVWLANCHRHEILRIDPDSGVVRRLPVDE